MVGLNYQTWDHALSLLRYRIYRNYEKSRCKLLMLMALRKLAISLHKIWVSYSSIGPFMLEIMIIAPTDTAVTPVPPPVTNPAVTLNHQYQQPCLIHRYRPPDHHLKYRPINNTTTRPPDDNPPDVRRKHPFPLTKEYLL